MSNILVVINNYVSVKYRIVYLLCINFGTKALIDIFLLVKENTISGLTIS